MLKQQQLQDNVTKYESFKKKNHQLTGQQFKESCSGLLQPIADYTAWTADPVNHNRRKPDQIYPHQIITSLLTNNRFTSQLQHF